MRRLQPPVGAMVSTPVAVRTKCTVIINTKAGDSQNAALEEQLETLLEAHGFDPTMHLVSGDALDALLSEGLPAQPTLIIAVGGDGTVHAVASALAGTPHRMGILPLGTVNVFARTLRIPLELEEAVEVLATGRDQPVDVSDVNGTPFLNNCAIGIYAELTRLRERRRGRHRRLWKPLRWALDTLTAGWEVLRCWRLLRVRLFLDGQQFRRRVPLVLVSGNDYQKGWPGHRLGDGQLAVYVPKRTKRLPLIGALLKAALFRPEEVESLEIHFARQATVMTRPGEMRLAIDGEVKSFAGPFRFRSREGALTVRVPREVEG